MTTEASTNGTSTQTTQSDPNAKSGGAGDSKTGERQSTQAVGPSQSDIEAIVNNRIAQVQKTVKADVTKTIIKSLGGGDEGDREHPIHSALIAEPEGFVKQIIKTATDEAVATVTQSMHVKDEAAKAFTTAADEYPDLRKVKNEVLAEFGQLDPNLSVSERMTTASKKVVERMGWKSKTESQNDKSVKDAAMSPGGYAPSREAVEKLPATGKDFISIRKAQFMKNTGREAPKATA